MSRFAFSLALALAVAAALSPAALQPAWAQQARSKMSPATRALFDAVAARDIDAARTSLNNGADTDAENDNGQTAADLAVDNGFFDIAHLILAVRSQQRAAAQPKDDVKLPPPPAPYTPTPPDKSAAASEPHVGPPISSQPSVSVASVPMPAPVTKVELAKPVSLFRPPQPVPPQAALPRPVAPTAPQVTPVRPPAAVSPPVIVSPKVVSSAPAQPATQSESPPRAQPAPAAAAPSQSRTQKTAASANPISKALSGVGNFFSKTFSTKKEKSYSEVETSSGGPAATTGDGNAVAPVSRAPEVADLASENAHETANGPALKGVALTLDGASGLGRKLDPAEKDLCIARRRGTTYFCLEAAHWPSELADVFNVTTRVYAGDQAVVRYDNGTSTRMYAIFAASGFAKVALYLQQKYGAPTQRLTERRGIVSDHSRINVILRWISKDPKSGAQTVLEVRKIDDLRGMMPEPSTGVIRLFNPKSEEIFKYLSEADFVLLRIREDSEHRFPKN